MSKTEHVHKVVVACNCSLETVVAVHVLARRDVRRLIAARAATTNTHKSCQDPHVYQYSVANQVQDALEEAQCRRASTEHASGRCCRQCLGTTQRRDCGSTSGTAAQSSQTPAHSSFSVAYECGCANQSTNSPTKALSTYHQAVPEQLTRHVLKVDRARRRRWRNALLYACPYAVVSARVRHILAQSIASRMQQRTHVPS